MTSPPTLTPDEEFVQQFLAHIGISAEKLPESASAPSCDFRAVDGSHLYWVEVKSRTGDKTVWDELKKRDTATRTHTMGYHPTMARLLDDAVGQLDASSQSEMGFEIACMVFVDPGDADLHCHQLIATVFGIHHVLDLAKLGEGGAAKRCYFFGESIFFKHKQLDAVVAFDRTTSRYTMCVNPCSTRRAAFGDTKLYRHFEALAHNFPDAIHDPTIQEKAGRAYLADCTIPRKNEAAVLEYVKQKYGLIKPKHYVLDRTSSTARVPRDTPSD